MQCWKPRALTYVFFSLPKRWVFLLHFPRKDPESIVWGQWLCWGGSFWVVTNLSPSLHGQDRAGNMF